MKKNLLIALIISASSLSADSKYDRALLYLNGDIGGKKVSKKVPRCPYDRCEGDVIFEHIKKDTKTAYKLLKEASHESNLLACATALDILLKQIDYKSKNYDGYLLEKLNKDYGIGSKTQYDLDVKFYISSLSQSSNKEQHCLGNYMLFESYRNGYFGFPQDSLKAGTYKSTALESCEKNSFRYLMLKR